MEILMRATRVLVAILAVAMIFALGCAQQRASNPSVKDNVENSLEQAGLQSVNVDEDRDKGVITLKGEVKTDAEKARAEEVARQAAGNSIIANQLLVTGADEGKAEDVASATDDAIEAQFKAWVEKNNLTKQDISADAKNGVLTLTGDVDNAAIRSRVERDAAKITGVQQVVNKLEIEKK
jgi:hyperosmotically inducible protein